MNLDNRVGGLLSNTALILTTDHSHITLLTPRGTPRVLHNPVRSISSSISIIADSQHTMVLTSTSPTLLPPLTGEPRAPLPPSRINNSAVPAGLSLPLVPLRVLTRSRRATSSPCPSNSWLTALLPRVTRVATVV